MVVYEHKHNVCRAGIEGCVSVYTYISRMNTLYLIYVYCKGLKEPVLTSSYTNLSPPRKYPSGWFHEVHACGATLPSWKQKSNYTGKCHSCGRHDMQISDSSCAYPTSLNAVHVRAASQSRTNLQITKVHSLCAGKLTTLLTSQAAK